MLEIDGISVHFGGVIALQGVSLRVPSEAVTGVIGPNGAGKTTLFDVVAGLRRPQAGKVLLDGMDITNASPVKRARMGIGRTFQRLEVFGSLTVRENIQVAIELRRSWAHGTAAEGIRQETMELLERVGLTDVAGTQADLLSTGSSRMMELGRALAIRPGVLLLDEPASGLDDHEVEVLADLIAAIARDGTAVALVEHDVDLVMRICSQIWVLESGRVIASGTADQVQQDRTVIGAYLGSESVHAADSGEATTAPRVDEQVSPESGGSQVRQASGQGLSLREVHAGYGNIEVLHGVSLVVNPGEVVALLGPNGAGKTTLLRAASGQLGVSSGDVTFDGQAVVGKPPDRLARTGLCTIPEIRGIFPNLSVVENLQMWSFASGHPQSAIQKEVFGRFPQLQARAKQQAGTLSGGEQQMLAVARALVSGPKILLLDEISMGLAPLIVGVLYEAVVDLARAGVGILIVEQFAKMALGMADRAAVLRGGLIVLTGDPGDVARGLSDVYLGVANK